MPSLFFTCPNTRQLADTGIMTDAESLRDTWSMTLNVNCPHCGANARGVGARDLHRRCDPECVGDRAKPVRAAASPRLRGIVCRSDLASWCPAR